jgi:amino acid permease
MEKRLENSQKYFCISVPSFAAVNEIVSGPLMSMISCLLAPAWLGACALEVWVREYSDSPYSASGPGKEPSQISL